MAPARMCPLMYPPVPHLHGFLPSPLAPQVLPVLQHSSYSRVRNACVTYQHARTPPLHHNPSCTTRHPHATYPPAYPPHPHARTHPLLTRSLREDEHYIAFWNSSDPSLGMDDIYTVIRDARERAAKDPEWPGRMVATASAFAKKWVGYGAAGSGRGATVRVVVVVVGRDACEGGGNENQGPCPCDSCAQGVKFTSTRTDRA